MTKANSETFRDLGLIDPICANLEKLGITSPTAVQRDSIPLVLADRDIICESATGSGKTIAFGAGLIDKLSENRGEKVLILTPTRELAEQVCDALKTVSRGMKVKTCVIYGGVGYAQQISNFERSDIVVATPGRLLDHVKQKNFELTDITRIVLDEADRMLDMGFLPDVKLILRHLPHKKQFLCFSATFSHEIAATTRDLLNNPARVVGEKAVDPRKLEQIYYDVHGRDKFSLLLHLLKNEKSDAEIIFTNSRKMADVLETNLRKFNIRASALHGGFTQSKRMRVLDDFQKKKLTCLIATDVAARGLDIPHVSHVYNYDLPPDSKQYIHRIGRTARAGAEGIAISLVSQRDHEDFDKIIRFERVPIELEEKPDFEKVKVEFDFNNTSESRGGSRGGGRGGSRDGGRGGFSRGGSRDGGSRGGFNRGRSDSGSRGGFNRGSDSRGESRPPRRDGEGRSERPAGFNHGGDRAPRRNSYSQNGARSGSREGGDSRGGSRGGYSRDGARSGSREDRGGRDGSQSRHGSSDGGSRNGGNSRFSGGRPPRRD